jgi:hypothetical protein
MRQARESNTQSPARICGTVAGYMAVRRQRGLEREENVPSAAGAGPSVTTLPASRCDSRRPDASPSFQTERRKRDVRSEY